MNNSNLLLTFTTSEDTRVQVRNAARISVDGMGGLIVYDSKTGTAERISLAQLNSFCIDRPASSIDRPATASVEQYVN